MVDAGPEPTYEEKLRVPSWGSILIMSRIVHWPYNFVLNLY